MTAHAIDKTHKIAGGLCPVDLEANGLMSALMEFSLNISDGLDIACAFMCDKPVLVHNSSIATNLFRIAQEAVHNAIKHSRAKHIWIRLKQGNGQIIMAVEDDGIGFPTPFKSKKTMGLYLMKYRAKVINSRLDIGRNSRAE